MKTLASAAHSQRNPLPVPANEEGAPHRRALIIELSPWLRDARADFVVAEVHAPPLDAAGSGWVQHLADLLATWMQRSRQRRQLAKLSDTMLKDIGLSRADVHNEATRRFWQD
jgi:uncharacterized protein YjiS (DUF1127 family)